MAGTTRCSRLLLAALAAAPLVAGCATTQVRVVQRTAVDRTRASIYVIVYECADDPYAAGHARKLSAAMMNALGPHTGARWSTVLTGLEFDTRSVDQQMDSLGAQAVLTLKPIGARTDRYGETVALVYGATLTDRPSNQPLWAAKAEISGTVDLGIQDVADKIVADLARDHMIGPVVASN
ncbi:MAG TPA: hypothetical protein VKQ32_08255 [Polyangia bacterium]|nr:hypothetical protein [Polyangia bacterium]